MERPSLWDAACKTQDNGCDHILQKELTVNEDRISGPNLAILQKADRGTPNSSKTSCNFRRDAVRRDGNASSWVTDGMPRLMPRPMPATTQLFPHARRQHH